MNDRDTIDLRSLLATGQSPFPLVEAKVRGLAAGERLDLLAPFEPTPLYPHLEAWGAEHSAAREGDGFRITVTKSADPLVPLYLDLRELVPPEPFIRTHDALESLPAGSCLIVHLPHRPTPLLEHFDREGIEWEEQTQTDGTCQLYVMKPDRG